MARVIHDTRYVEREGEAYHSFAGPMSLAARIVLVISGIINAILALRFVLVLLGANPGNQFAAFIYDLSRPLVAPFFGLFNYSPTYSGFHFEFETLIAMAVYSLIAWGLVQLLTLGRGDTIS